MATAMDGVRAVCESATDARRLLTTVLGVDDEVTHDYILGLLSGDADDDDDEDGATAAAEMIGAHAESLSDEERRMGGEQMETNQARRTRFLSGLELKLLRFF